MAVAEVHDGRVGTTSFAELEPRIADLAAGLRADGVRPGDRVALLVPPGVDLTVAVYACWRAGAVIVVADAGLGLRGLGHALRSAAPDHVIGIRRALLAVRALRRARRLIPAAHRSGWLRRGAGLGAEPGRTEPPGPRRADPAATRPGRRGGGAVHLRRDRPGQGRGLHAWPAQRPDRPGPAGHGADRGRPAGRRLRPVRPVRAGAGRRPPWCPT